MKYYPSPFRRDYTLSPNIECPYKNMKPEEKQRDYRRSNNRKQISDQLVDTAEKQKKKSIIYKDGILLEDTRSHKVGIFFINWPGSSEKHYSDLGILFYSLAETKNNDIAIKRKVVPHGKNYSLYGSGLTIMADYKYGVLHGWLIGYCPDKFLICHQYKEGVREGKQYYYDYKQQLLAISLYHKGSLQTIQNIFVDKIQKLITDKVLLEQLVKVKNLDLDCSKTDYTKLKVSNKMKYIGQVSKQNGTVLPDGYGVLFSDKEIYMGLFISGFLSNIGFIKFAQEKSYYFGDLNFGACAGYGCFCSNQRIAYRFGNEDIRREEFIEYIRLNFSMQKNERWMSQFQQMVKLAQYFQLKSETKLEYEDYSIRKISIVKNRGQSLNKSDLSQGISIDLGQLDYKDEKDSDKILKNLVYVHNKNENLQKQYYTVEPLTPQKIKPVLSRPSNNTKTQKKPQYLTLPKAQNIITLNEREDIRFQQIGMQNDHISPQLTKVSPNKFTSQQNFKNQSKTNNLLTKKGKPPSLNIGYIYRQDSEQMEDNSNFFEQINRM